MNETPARVRFPLSSAGSSTVELSLVTPVLVLLLLGILDFAQGLNAYAMIASASREGARYASVHPDATPLQIVDAVLQRSAPLKTDLVKVVPEYFDGTGFKPWPAPPARGLAPRSTNLAPVPVRVTVSYPWSATTFMVGNFIAGGTGRVLSASSTMQADR